MGLSWLEEYGFDVDIIGRKLVRKLDGMEIKCRERRIPSIESLKPGEELKRSDVIMILDIEDRYKDYAAL